MIRSDAFRIAQERDRVRAMTADARRDQVLQSYQNLQSMLYDALIDDPWDDLWIVDFGTDWVVWESWGRESGLWQQSYEIDDGNCAFLTGDPQEVVSVVTYAPVSRSDRVLRWLYASETRVKYTQAEIDELGKKGQAFKNEDGHYSYPIADTDDLSNAIHAVGRGGADHDAIRKYVIKRAKSLGESDEIPDNWNSDGSLKEEDSSMTPTDTRVAGCPGCGSASPAADSSGEMRCPDCGAYRGDTSVTGANSEDGSGSAGSVNAPGVADGTGSVSSSEPSETRCSCQHDEAARGAQDPLVKLNQALLEFVSETTRGYSPVSPSGKQAVVEIAPDASAHANSTGSAGNDAGGDGVDGSDPIDEDVGDADTPPHPENTDDQGKPQREDPNVDEGDSKKDGNPFPSEQESEPERLSQRRHKSRRSSTPAPKPEHRRTPSASEIRTVSTGGSSVLNGTAIVYNEPYTVYDMFGAFVERMDPAVCNYVLASSTLDVRALLNHDGLPYARSTSGTLELNNTAAGLDTVWNLSESSRQAADLADAIARRDITQMSVAFRVAEDEWDEDFVNRTVRSFSDLSDVSVVTYPASPTTSVDVAKRMLYALPVEARDGVLNAYKVVCDVRAGSRLDSECSDAVLRALESVYNVDDPQVPLVRVREAWKIARDVRAGKTLSASNAGFIAAALESLHRADDVDIPEIVRSLSDVDDALDAAQAALSQVSGLPDPDDDDPTRVDEGEKVRQRELALEEAAEKRRRAAKAQRRRMTIRTPRVQA